MIADIVFFVAGLLLLSAVWFAAGYWYARSRAPIPPPREYKAEEILTVRDLNTSIRDNLVVLSKRRKAS